MSVVRKVAGLLVAVIGCSTPPTPDPVLRAELLKRAELDQAQMLDLATDIKDPALRARLQRMLDGNARWLDSIVTTRGAWPGTAVVDSGGANAAFLIAQHGDSVDGVQTRLLASLRAAWSAGQAPGHHVAFLEDRVRSAQKRPQLYGTQVAYDSAANAIQPDVEAPDGLDARRALMGLPPMATYIATLRDMNATLRAMSNAPKTTSTAK